MEVQRIRHLEAEDTDDQDGSDLAMIRWDLIDPKRPKKEDGNATGADSTVTQAKNGHVRADDDVDEAKATAAGVV